MALFDSRTITRLATMANGTGAITTVNGEVAYLGSALPHVGTIAGATAALNGTLTRIGDPSAFRVVYRDHAGWVYKVPKCGTGRDNDLQAVEYFDMATLRNRRFPYVGPVGGWIIDGVLIVAMPYYPLRATDSAHAWRQFRNMVDHNMLRLALPEGGQECWDMHEGNVRATASGRLRIIDLGGIEWRGGWPF